MSCVSIGDRYVRYLEKKDDRCVRYFAEIGDKVVMPYTIIFIPLLYIYYYERYFANAIKS